MKSIDYLFRTLLLRRRTRGAKAVRKGTMKPAPLICKRRDRERECRGGGGGGGEEGGGSDGGRGGCGGGKGANKVHVVGGTAEKPASSVGVNIRYVRKGAIVELFDKKSVVAIDGCARVKLVEGEASIHGFQLRKGKDVTVTSNAKIASAVVINNGISFANPNITHECDITAIPRSTACDCYDFKKTVLEVRSLHDCEEEDQECVAGDRSCQLGFQLVSGRWCGELLGETVPSNERLPGDSWPMTIICRSWCDAAKEVCSYNTREKNNMCGSQQFPVPIVAVCGPNNSGKSTVGKMLVNSLLNVYPQVAYLDTDLGQPEFTVPGCLSLHVLHEPFYGPPYMHLRKPERFYFYGDVSPSVDPVRYLFYIFALYRHFREVICTHGTSGGLRNSEAIPLVINTHGWIRGIGFEMLVDILRYICPTHVFQMGREFCRQRDSAKQLPMGKFWCDLENSGDEGEYLQVKQFYLTLRLSHPSYARKGISGQYLRNLRLLAFWESLTGRRQSSEYPFNLETAFLSTAEQLTMHRPYHAPLAALKFQHALMQIPEKDILYTANGRLIGLAYDGADVHAQNAPVNVAEKEPSPPCIEIGLVRSIDVEKGVLYLLSPSGLRELRRANVILLGLVEMPVSLLNTTWHRYPYAHRNPEEVKRPQKSGYSLTSRFSDGDS